MAKPTKHYGKWRVRWTDENGRRHSEIFERREDALFAQRKHEQEVAEIERGLRSPLPPDKSVGDLCDYWLKHRAPRKRSAKDDESLVRRHIRPDLGTVRLRDFGLAHADAFIAKRGHLDPKTVNNILTLLISMLRVGHELGWIARVPKIHKTRIPLFDSDFSYLRTKEEIARFLAAAKAEGDLVFALYATAVYTGMRQGELAGLQWGDVDLDGRLIAVQRSFDGPTKAGDVRYVPILDPLLPVLREWRLKCPGKLVFPNQADTMHGPSARVFQEVLHRVLKAAAFPTVQRRGRSHRYIVFHDLRHTFASHWVMGGGDLFKLQKVLGHKSAAMTLRYSHLSPDAFAADYGRLGAATGPGAKVIPLAGG